MFKLSTKTEVAGIPAKQVYDFMIDCNDEKYHEWWPEEHFRFHTVKYFPGHIGSVVYFDEMIGNRRVKTYAVIRKVEENKSIEWQMRTVLPAPVWIELKLEEHENSISITHTLKVGFNGLGRFLDIFFKMFFSKRFEENLDKHVKHEFKLLATKLASAA